MSRFPLATALRDTLPGYNGARFRQDALAALVVSLVALPLSMALAIAVGLPPQHGIYTAIVAGIIAPLLGGSVTQVSGPTAAFVVIIAPIVAEHGLRGIILAQMMAGIMLVALAWARLGKFINFVPYPVTTGFTSGIAVVLGALSLNDFLGLGLPQPQGSFLHKLSLLAGALPQLRWQECAVGMLSLALMVSGKRFSRRIPSVIFGIGAGTLLAYVLSSNGIAVDTLGTRFSYDTPSGVIQGIPPYPPQLHWFGMSELFAWPRYEELKLLLMPAAVIAALAALESLLSATVADGLSRTRHDPNAELAAIGIANVASGFVAGIPATGAIARTTTNIKSGARTPLASAMHGLLILLYVLSLAPLISHIPMASLAALLLVTAYNMSHYRQFLRILRIAPRHDKVVLVACFTLTVFIDMVAGVAVGMILAAVLFIQRISEMTQSEVEEGGALAGAALPDNVMMYRINGPLFFATVERVLDRTAFLRSRIDTLVFDMRQVPLIDMTGLVAIKNLLTSEAMLGKRIIICARPDVASRIEQKLADTPHGHVRMERDYDAMIASLTASGA